MGERRGLNPRMMESQSIALPLGYARHFHLWKRSVQIFIYENTAKKKKFFGFYFHLNIFLFKKKERIYKLQIFDLFIFISFS